MLVKPPMEKLLPKVENRYVLAILVAKRARQLVNGGQPLINSDSPNLVTVACEELGSNRIACVKGHLSPYIPLRPEIEAARLAAQAAAEQASTADAIREELEKAGARGSTYAGSMNLDDAALIGEALTRTIENSEDDENTPDNLHSENNSTDDADDEGTDDLYINRNTNSAHEDFPIKLAPPIEATQMLEKLKMGKVEEEA